jgi:membrane associated rhomboid family serine protease
MEHTDKSRLLKSMLIPGILLFILWLVKLLEIWLKTDFSEYGLNPQNFKGLRGILFSPFLHSNFAHLSANSVPLFVLGAGLFYFYEKLAGRILAMLWLTTGFWVWAFAKDTGIHIGASGVVYALAAFHFTGGLLRKEPRMMAFALLVVFLYGGLIWGVIPDFLPEKNISWESHLLGLLAGGTVAFFYRSSGPQRKEYEWPEEDENEEEDDGHDQEPDASAGGADERTGNSTSAGIDSQDGSQVKIVYHLKKSGDNNQA